MALRPDSLSDLLSKLTASLDTANITLPAVETATPPANGISLLDAKSELFLSYLQNLAFLILIKLRNGSSRRDDLPSDDENSAQHIHDKVVRKLVELRIYLEKGIRPLEGRLKYQIDKVIRAAETSERNEAQKATRRSNPGSKSRSVAATHETNGNESSEANGSDDEDGGKSDASIDDLAYRPNLTAFVNDATPAQASKASNASKSTDVYRPPRIKPTSLHTTMNPDSRVRGPRKPLRSNAIDDYLSNEFSTAPAAEASIGSTIIDGGRTTRSAKEQKEESRRTAYEEANFMRLAPLSKKEKAKRRDARVVGFGGEDLRMFGDGLDRIGGMTKKRSEGRATEDGPRGEGFGGSGEHTSKKRRFGRK